MTVCSSSNCNLPALSNKAHCLEHHKQQDNYHYGLDHEIAQKLAAKWDDQKAKQVLEWLATLTGKSIPVDSDFHATLKSGVLLCEAFNVLFPGSIAPNAISKSAMAFPQRENLTMFMSAARAKGLCETDMFVTDDLYEKRNLVVVLDSIIALGQLAKAKAVNAPVLSVNSVSKPAPIDIQAEIKAHSEAAKGAIHAAVAPSASTSYSLSGSAPVALSNAPRFCGECGAARIGSSKFCGECGKPL